MQKLLRAKSLSSLPPGWHADGRGLYLLVTSTVRGAGFCAH